MLSAVPRRAATRAPTSAPLQLLAQRFKQTAAKEQYLKPVSTIPTYHFQPSLPRLPIPKLDETLDKYIKVTQPLLTSAEHEATRAAVEEFRQDAGPRLHRDLVEWDAKNRHTSYISGMWFDMYLSDRTPLPINYNPQITLNKGAHDWTQAQRAAALVFSALRFHRSLKDEVLVPDVYHTGTTTKTPWWEQMVSTLPASISYYGAVVLGAYPLDMSQYKNLFASTRVPTQDKDVLLTAAKSRHIVVQRRGHFYKMEVIAENGDAHSQADILGAFESILKRDDAPDAQAVGILTTENRDVWAKARASLKASNAASLAAIDEALFVVSLDDEKIDDLAKLSRNFLFGNGRNRWFDKSFSLIITGSGKSAINFEHSWGDGVAIVRFMEEVFADSNANGPAKAVGGAFKPVEKLSWTITPDVSQAITAAGKRFDDDTARMNLEVLTTDVLNKEAIKGLRVSPDGFLQMAFQLAYYRLHGKTVSTYESASTAGFKHGRTECIRSATTESATFTHVFSSKDSTLDQRDAALRRAIATHSKNSLDGVMGKGVDRHLFALRKFYQQQNPTKPLPAIFTDKGYQLMNHNTMSTSTLASAAIEGGGFGPVVPDGYGIGYGMDKEFMRFNVTTFKPMEIKPFLSAIDNALHDMKKAAVHGVAKLAEKGKAKAGSAHKGKH